MSFLLLGFAKGLWAYDFSAVAPTGQTLYYNYVNGSSGSSVFVTYPGSGADYSGYTAPTGTLTIPLSVSYSGHVYSVTSIGSYAFSGCSGLVSVSISRSVTSIGDYAFENCSGLTSVAIPNTVTSIGDYAFYDCTGLTSVTIPNSVTYIGYYAFNGVLNLIYDGSATGSPWGARCVNGYVEGGLVFADSTKTTIKGC